MNSDGSTLREHLELLGKLDENGIDNHLLVRSSEVMRRYAELYCREGDPIVVSNCFRYHRWWQYWRLLGLAATPNWHGKYLKDWFSVVEGLPAVRILICGTADYGILHHLVGALPPDSDCRIEIVILDYCRTPLEICSWYQVNYMNHLRCDLRLSRQRGDALRLPFRDESFDLVITYSLLSRFPYHEKQTIIEEWRRSLKQNGSVATSFRLSSSPAWEVERLDPIEFSELIVRKVVSDRPSLAVAQESIRLIASNYAESVFRYTTPTRDPARELFEGFDAVARVGVLHSRFQGEIQYLTVVAQKDG
jgi:SAM-dependent methyltransferase